MTEYQSKTPVYLVHGYKFDPASNGSSNPHKTLYVKWRENITEWPVYEFSYYSAPGICGYYRAFKQGYRDAYSWAYNDLSVRAGRNLHSDMASRDGGPFNIICHSLGSRVSLGAIRLGAPVDRCILLNGAEMSSVAEETAIMRPDVTFFNVYAKTDAVVDIMAENFTPGGGGDAIGNDGVKGIDNWINIILDDKRVKTWGKKKGWDLKGDNPRHVMDHWMTHTWTPNWQLYRAILDGQDINDIPKV